MPGRADEEGLRPEIADDMFSEQSVVPVDSDAHRLTGQTHWGLDIALEPTPYGIRYKHGGNNDDFTSSMALYQDKGLGYVPLTNSDNAAALNTVIEPIFAEGR